MKKGAPVPPYGVAIQQAIASGEVGQMKKAAKDAEKHLNKVGDVGEGLKKLRAEIKRLEGTKRTGGADIIPYGDAIRVSLKSGDLKQMKDMEKQAEEWLKRASDVSKALADLRKGIKRLKS